MLILANGYFIQTLSGNHIRYWWVNQNQTISMKLAVAIYGRQKPMPMVGKSVYLNMLITKGIMCAAPALACAALP